ncbi:helix-turn-helix domain-containing protein [Enterococcus rotai]|uniref:helix-turn-helix domain-containing protein n=1 Tax=Enterococcus rotai TaxID=118060 RepID=UPI0032B42A0C
MLNYFLSEKDQSKLSILKMILFDSNGQFVHSIMEHCSLERRSVLRYLSDLKEDIAEVFPDKNVFLKQTNQIDKFIIYKDKETPYNEVVDSLRLNYIQKSNLYIVFNAVLTKNYVSVKQLSLDINISSAAVYKYLAIIDVFLKKFGSTLSIRKTEGNITGNELGTRYAIYFIYWFIFRTSELKKRLLYVPIELFDLSFVTESISSNIELSLSQKSKLEIIQAVTLYRVIYRKKTLDMPDTFWADVHFFYQQNLHFNPKFEKKIPAGNLHKEKLFFSFAMRGIIHNIDSFEKKQAIVSAYKNSDLTIANQLTVFLNRFQNKFHFPRTSKDEIELYYVLIMAFIYFKHMEVDTLEFFGDHLSLERFMERNPHLHYLENEIIKFVDEENKELNFDLTSNSNNSLTQLTHYLFWSIAINSQIQPVAIYIQCSRDVYMANTIEKMILRFINPDSVKFTDKISEADIIIADMYEGEYPQVDMFYFEGTFDPKIWSDMIFFITQALWKKYT